MEEHQQQPRGRSSSAGHHSNHNHNISHSRSPQRYPDHATALRLDPAVNPSTFSTGAFNTTPLTSSATTESQYSYSSAAYLEAPYQALQYEQLDLQGTGLQEQELGQTYKQENLSPNPQNNPSNLNFEQSSQQLTPSFLDPNAPIDFGGYTQKLNHMGAQDQSFNSNLMLDPQLQGTSQPSHHTMNPADLMSSNMSSPHLATPPNLLQPDSQPSPAQQSPSSGPFYSPGHSRQASLDPSAAYGHGQGPPDWTGMLTGANFQTHRRAPSEHSDVSSSVAPSPFLPQSDSFDTFDGNSPMLNAQQDNTLYQDALAIEQFSLSEPQQQQHQQQQRITPAHSPYASPHIPPHEGLGISQQENSFILTGGMNNQFNGGPRQDMYGNHTIQNIPDYHQRNGSSDMGQATQMAPPEINVEFAPPSRQHVFDHPNPKADADALSPPERRGRRDRARSDPFGTSISRPRTPSDPSSTLSVDPNHRNRSLSPLDGPYQPGSRSPSPGTRTLRRSSTSSINPDREYLLDLADPTRPTSGGPENPRRIQKHPATFQCTLCPKRFTRAYNLRSHLRTHTDERPFVCTVCGKAFARQHDRKRHEGLHSGEKKFVCRGDLGAGGTWGCGRRFARADALGRHFRSEAGRICIKPLLDEEAMERQRLWEEQMMGAQAQGMGMPGGNGLSAGGQMDLGANAAGNGAMQNNGGFSWPAALLAQHPALQTIPWDQLGNGNGHGGGGGGGGAGVGGDDGADLNGTAGFDNGSGGDYFDEDDEGSGYVSGPGTGFAHAHAQQGGWGAVGEAQDWASDYEGR